MRRDWTTLGPKLVVKIHLTAGTSDQWFLANAVRYVEAFLKSTKDPYDDGSVEFGERFIHCYQGDPSQPLSVSSRTVYRRQMPVMADRMLKTRQPARMSRVGGTRDEFAGHLRSPQDPACQRSDVRATILVVPGSTGRTLRVVRDTVSRCPSSSIRCTV